MFLSTPHLGLDFRGFNAGGRREARGRNGREPITDHQVRQASPNVELLIPRRTTRQRAIEGY